MTKILVSGLMFVALLLQTREEKLLFYVIPNIHSNQNCSHNQSCLTFKQFLDFDPPDESSSITMIFLTGHFYAPKEQHDLFYRKGIFPDNVAMVGASREVIMHNINIDFYSNKLQVKNITLCNSEFQLYSEVVLLSITGINTVVRIEEAKLVQLHNCTFSNGTNSLSINKSNVIFSGNTEFFNNHNSALLSYNSNITLSGKVSFTNNTGIRGGAMALYSSTVELRGGLNISFISNSAQETGGAIYIEPDMINTCRDSPMCFYNEKYLYYFTSCGKEHRDITLYYIRNSAQLGGDNIYGTSLTLCTGLNKKCFISHIFSSNDSMSSVSSDPFKVCLCDSNGQPQCNNVPEFLISKSVYPGEQFTIPAVIIGGDYGTTIGTVHASFTSANQLSIPVLEADYQYSQWIHDISRCTDLKYIVFSKHIRQNFTMSLTVYSPKRTRKFILVDILLREYTSLPHISTFINMTIVPCPIGFSLLEKPSKCDCNPILKYSGVKCSIIDERIYFSWNNTLWIGIKSTGFTYAEYCPLQYCDPAGRELELGKDPSSQCAFNRAGRLCGGCREGYSLAIGSSHCIKCPNNNGLALVIFFAAAGVLLVFFINLLDITLAQSLLDGLTFYANIVWTYQSVLFPEQQNMNTVIVFLKTFIAWINLDFGIEICFVQGLTAYWKTWLQFVFPFYIWAIVGLMILTARHSRILTKLYGNRAVPVLATLFLLSYMKLLRTVTSIYMVSHIIQYPKKSTITVWSVDGTLITLDFLTPFSW